MTVQELIDELAGFDPEAEALFVAQKDRPMMYTVYKVCEDEDGNALIFEGDSTGSLSKEQQREFGFGW